jgi:hypothetical protein
MAMTRPWATTVATTLLGACMLIGTAVATPPAGADDALAPIKATVNGDRSRTGCSTLTYNGALEAAAQALARADRYQPQTQAAGYAGKTRMFEGVGDPQASAINGAYRGGAGEVINDCDYTDFGVGFIRNDSTEWDTVVLVFGAPHSVAASSASAAATPTPAPISCPPGSPTPTVPAGGTCAEVPPPVNKVSVSFIKGGPSWTVNVTNAANLAGTCTFTPNGPGGGLSNKTFDLAASGSVSFSVPPPLPFATYHVVTSCHGTFNGKTVEFGHDEQDISL